MNELRLRPRLGIAVTALAVGLVPGWASANDGRMSQEERHGVVEALASSQKAFVELVSGVDASDWFRAPAPDKWSVGEVAEHLLLSEKLLFGFIEQALAAEPNPDWQTATAGKMERIQQFMPNRTIKAQAPGPLQPSGEISRQDCLSELAAARARTLEFAEATQLPIKRYTAKHPAEFFGDLNVYQWMHFLAAHHARHNAQITEVKDWLENARNGVTRSSARDFSIRHEAILDVPAMEIYRAITADIAYWWDPAHTFSGDASNLSVDARPQGCFCEALPDGGGVRHLTVVHADPGRTLRLSGGLGPLQSEGVAGSMTWSMEPVDGGTRLVLTYNVSGTVDGGLDAWAGAVGQVLKSQFQRLAGYLTAR